MNGPDPETLKNLHGMLPSFVDGHKKRKLQGKGIKGAVTHPRKVCKICCKLFDLVTDTNVEEPVPGVCENCQKMLDDGNTAFVADKRFVFAKSTRLADLAGTIQLVAAHVMDKLEAQFDANKASDDNSGKAR